MANEGKKKDWIIIRAIKPGTIAEKTLTLYMLGHQQRPSKFQCVYSPRVSNIRVL